jgi:hydroxymethylpyrimidine/phosphomethylpyrimidine kinase
MTPTALTIAGSDSGAGAGVQADLKTFEAHGVYGTSAITAVTAQNTVGVTMIQPLNPQIVRAQIEAVMSDIGAHAAKTGMLSNAAIVTTVARELRQWKLPFVVVDPVMVAKSGHRLLDDEGLRALTAELLPIASVVTPNLPEAEALSGMSIRDDEDRREAARKIAKFGASAVVIKGGHARTSEIVDLLYDGTQFVEFRHERIPGPHTHGTGCTFAASLAATLALGRPLSEAIPVAQRYIAGAMKRGVALGRGHQPMNHFWNAEARKTS